MIVHSSELEQHKDKQLVCPSLEVKAVTEYHTCNLEANLPSAVFIRKSTTPVEQETIKQLFVSISSKFGKEGKLSDVFALFAPFVKDVKNVLFDVSLTS